MSERLTRELGKLKYASVTKLNDEHYIINKATKLHLEIDRCYLIRLGDSVYNPNTILSSNWNGGRIPRGRFYQVHVDTIMSNMVKITGVGYMDANCSIFADNWFGWLPIEDVEVIRKL